MKKLSSILPILALLLAVAGAVAMKPAPKNNPVLTYYFTGVSGEEFDPTKYSTSAPSGGCSGTNLTCQFSVPDGFTDIADYLNWLDSQENKQSLYNERIVSTRN